MGDVFTMTSAIIGTGAVTALITQWFARRQKRDELEAKRDERADTMTAEERRDAIGILREALAEKRKDHVDCLARVEKVEIQQAQERIECDRKIGQLADHVSHLSDLVASRFPDMRDSLPPTR